MCSTFFTFVNTVPIKKILILFQITTDYNLEKDCSECFALRNFQAKEQASIWSGQLVKNLFDKRNTLSYYSIAKE